jgi:hypothetical protein
LRHVSHRFFCFCGDDEGDGSVEDVSSGVADAIACSTIVEVPVPCTAVSALSLLVTETPEQLA